MSRQGAVAAILALGLLGGAVTVGVGQPSTGQPALPSKNRLPGPAPDEVPDGPLGASIRYGERILTQTRVYAKEYTGNGLNCTSCHLDKGRKAYSSPWVGTWGVFPEYRSRNAKVNLLEDRVNDCFERSMNGRPLPRDGEEMRAILAYIWWLSRDLPVGVEPPGRGFVKLAPVGPTVKGRGEAVYDAKCAVCHGRDGQGLTSPSGDYLFPPLWGPQSFNIGAGMARRNTAAAFVKANMPYGQDGTLTDQEAYDVAAYFTEQPRPDFSRKDEDWPKGDKPPDARY